MSGASDTPETFGDEWESELHELVARCADALERGGEPEVESILAGRPELADRARAQLDGLRRAGLLEAEPRTAAALPRRIGPYELLERIGAGGMGEVFLAEQHEPVRRRVAVKLLKPGLDSREILARFAQEQQILAVMSHPHIARVFGAGITPDGEPYIAMEHVPGIPLTGYCDERALEPRARLRLFLAVCDAVQHAHHQGVIHRDLKPSNVLVMEQDGSPVPKIIDFGVAKAVQAFAPSAVYTQLGVMIGTPEYMSPEQAARGEIDVDTRADVYSLGVILYELLTGSLPFDSQRLRAAGYEHMLGILRAEEPQKPSERVTPGTENARDAARLRGTDAVSLRRRLRGDLDWIVLKALEKDRNRRYSTPSELAADVARAVLGEPVSARPPSTWYRLSRTVRRYRLRFAAAGLGVAGLLLALGATLSASFSAQHSRAAARVARTAADEARQRADSNFDRAVAAVDEMLTRVGETTLAGVPQMERVRRDLLARALRFHQEFLAQRGSDLGRLRRVALAHAKVGRIQSDLGEHEAAAEAHRAAIAAYTDVLAAAPGDAAVLVSRATSQGDLANELKHLGQFDRARPLYREAMAELERACARSPDQLDCGLQLVAVVHNLALLERGSAPQRADGLLRNAAARVDTLAAREPGDARVIRLLAGVKTELGWQLLAAGQVELAEQILVGVRDRLQRHAALRPGQPDAELMVLSVLERLAVLYHQVGRAEQAIEAGRAGVASWQKLSGQFPGSVEYRFRLAQAHNNLGAFLRDASQLDDSTAEFRSAVGRYAELAAGHPAVARYRDKLATAYRNLGALLLGGHDEGSLAEAEAAARRAFSLLEDLRREAPERLDYAEAAAGVLMQLGDIATRRGQHSEARGELEQAVVLLEGVRQELPGSAPTRDGLVSALGYLANAQLASGEAATAESTLERALALLTPALAAAPEHGFRRRQMCFLRQVQGRICVVLDDAAGAADAAEAMAAVADDGADCHEAAAAYAAAVRLSTPADGADDERRAAVEQRVARAVALLREANARGAPADRDPARDEDLAPLREWPAFQALLAEFAGR